MKNLYIVVVLIFALSVTGCSTMSAKNTQFTHQKKDSNKPSMTVMLCRPSSIMATLSSVGIMINGEPAMDLGNNEKWSIELPNKPIQQFKFVLPNDRFFNLQVPDSKNKTYIVFTITLDSFYVVAVTHKWQAKIVSEEVFNSECKSPKIQDLKHISL
jgi:hypothetical protein